MRLLVVVACGMTEPGGMTLQAETAGPFVAYGTLRSDAVTLVWSKVNERGGGGRYQLFRDGVFMAETAKTHHTFVDLVAGSTYAFMVRKVAVGGVTGEKVGDVLTVQTPAPEPVLDVSDYGAVGDGVTLNTRALQTAIDACPPQGVVKVRAGVYMTGALFLKSDMTLEIEAGAVLKGTSNPSDYRPFVMNRFEGWEMETHASLLNAGRLDNAGPANVRNLRIRGEGVISGGGKALSDAIRTEYPGVKGLRVRGRLILLMNAADIEVSGLTLEEPSGWLLHYVYSERVSLHGLTIRSEVRNGDGIDPDSSRDSLIFNCTFSTGDDCIAIKSGKNPEGNRIARPAENIRILDCRFERGHGISIGSEMSGGVRGVLIEDCVAGDLLHGMQIKATPARGGFVEDVVVRDCDLRQITIYTELPYNNDGEPAPTPPIFRNFRFENVDLTKADPQKPVIVINGFLKEGYRTRDVIFRDIRLPAQAVVTVDRAESVTFHGVFTAEGKAPIYNVNASENVRY